MLPARIRIARRYDNNTRQNDSYKEDRKENANNLRLTRLKKTEESQEVHLRFDMSRSSDSIVSHSVVRMDE